MDIMAVMISMIIVGGFMHVVFSISVLTPVIVYVVFGLHITLLCFCCPEIRAGSINWTQMSEHST
jgi:hypothetical protein